RLLLCNDRYRDTFPELKELLVPGLQFEALVRAVAENGLVPIAEGGEEDFIRKRMARHHKPQGPYEYYQTRGHWIRTSERILPDGITIGMREDISEQKLAEEAADISETTLSELVRIAPEAIITTSADMKIQLFNQAAERIFGYSPDEVLDTDISILLPERFRKGHGEHVDRFARSNDQYRSMNQRREISGLRKDGDEFPALASVSKLSIGGENTFAVVVRDITAQRRTEQELRRSQERFQIIAEAVPVPAVITRVSDGNIVFANEAATQFADGKREPLLGRISNDNWIDPDDRKKFLDELERVGRISEFEALIQRPDGAARSVLLSARFMEFDNEQVIFTSLVDITERKQAELILQQSEEKYRNLVDSSIQGVLVHQNGRIVYANMAAGAIHGYDFEKMIGLPVQQLFPEDEQDRIASFRDSRTEGHIEFRAVRPNGDIIWAEGFAHNIHWDGKPARQNTFINIDVRKKAQKALAESEGRFRSVIDNAPVAIVLKDKAGRVQLVNRAYEEFFQLSAEDVVGKTATDLYSPEISAWINADDLKILETKEIAVTEKEVSQPTLPVAFVRVVKFPVFDQTGAVSGIGTFALDISLEKVSEAQLRQSQKMEAVGQLTGGIAHDFNNMLAAIIGNLELIQGDTESGEIDREGIAIALRAAYRAAELTHRLLAFSRQQTLSPKKTKVNEILPPFCQLAERTIGEDIAIEMKLAANLWLTRVDPGELENAFLNLTVNARDAMPNGGQLIFETKNHVQKTRDEQISDAPPPGSFVLISVRDTGAGMSAKVREQAFEPYLTT
ncbi:MAG: PAS domain S-box protein, partial [Alphaproteobacteria bacterium]|nr:PAS domain S-box protein [Alphaproteobacteria bacterium]